MEKLESCKNTRPEFTAFISNSFTTYSLLEMNVKSAIQLSTRTLFSMLFYSQTPQQFLEQQLPFVNCDAMFYVHF